MILYLTIFLLIQSFNSVSVKTTNQGITEHCTVEITRSNDSLRTLTYLYIENNSKINYCYFCAYSSYYKDSNMLVLYDTTWSSINKEYPFDIGENFMDHNLYNERNGHKIDILANSKILLVFDKRMIIDKKSLNAKFDFYVKNLLYNSDSLDIKKLINIGYDRPTPINNSITFIYNYRLVPRKRGINIEHLNTVLFCNE